MQVLVCVGNCIIYFVLIIIYIYYIKKPVRYYLSDRTDVPIAVKRSVELIIILSFLLTVPALLSNMIRFAKFQSI